MAVRWLMGCAAVVLTAVGAGGASARVTARTDLASARAAVTQYSVAPAFVAPGPGFDASKARGKSVFIVPAGNTVADIASMGDLVSGMRQAGLAAGLKVTACSNHGTVKEWTACLNRGVAGKAGAIVLAGSIDLMAIQSSLADAKRAKIPVIAAHVLDPLDFATGVDSLYKHALQGVAATVAAPYAQAARLIADYVTATAGGAATRIVIAGASDLPEGPGMLATMQNEFANACGSTCTVSSIDVPTSKWQRNAISMVQKITLAQPTQYLIPLFDGMADLAAEGEADARAAYAAVVRPNICSFGGAPFAIQMGQAANRVVCDVGENMSWTGWATIDQTLRVLTGNQPVAENPPLRLWTASNWFSGGMTFPPTIDAGWGDPATTYVAGYRKLWGLS